MFTKKYVGPVDCASCEKGIVNLNGLRAENVNWNRLPFREPTERIARVSITAAACSLKMTVFVVCSMEPDSVSSWRLQVLRCKNQLSLKKTSTTMAKKTNSSKATKVTSSAWNDFLSRSAKKSDSTPGLAKAAHAVMA